MDRAPAVAGRFYEGDPGALAREVRTFLRAEAAPRPALGVVAPHAGYVYSGAIAGAVYARVAIPRQVIVLGPNHTGLGRLAALWPAGGGWRTPLGTVPVSRPLTEALARGAPLVEEDRAAHLREHSLEVHVPFLAVARPDVELAALCLGPLDLGACEEVGRTVADAARAHGALVVASSDMSHYVPAAEAREKDRHAIDRILALDPEGLHRTVRREGLTMCGVVPATVMLFAARALGARAAELVRYGHSGEVTGDDDEVVGYAGLIVS